ncbi:lambda-exonuclease family protein [Proteiniclasticum sp. QWL-01]|uniref:YqaJ viral recombinase family nuclease n=1 Tax=Proteiniclasticum sp. QWL-01 TaxID=3036945 RepID=UPI00240F8B0D|nr:YqaJ viral recombinase family protein [Proteiniclasticum sp. QWL-01]WFF72699.1 YqaJ viral recombinase family protein [Proteiniclasticum sp. QWL-01]
MRQYTELKTTDLSRSEWLVLRQKGIGGSDAGAILGLNKWKTPFQVYLDKTEPIADDEQSESAYWGVTLEDLVAREFTKRTGKKVRRNNRMLISSEYPWMIANLDREVVGEDAILECKTTNAFMAKEWEGDEIPASYMIQIQHYLAVTGAKKAYVAVLIGGQKFIWKEIQRDKELIQTIIDLERGFWTDHVLKGVPPALDGSSAAEKYLKEKYAIAEPGSSIDLKGEYHEQIEQYLSLQESIKELTAEANSIENALKNEMGDKETGFTPKYQVLWKNVVAARFDSKAFKAQHPDLADRFMKEISSRRFTVRQLKES